MTYEAKDLVHEDYVVKGSKGYLSNSIIQIPFPWSFGGFAEDGQILRTWSRKTLAKNRNVRPNSIFS